MIHSRQTNCQAGRFAGGVLLLIATAILPLAAIVRADDELSQGTAAARQRTLEQDRQKAKRVLEIDRRFVKASLLGQPKSSAEALRSLAELRHLRFKAALKEADRRVKWVGRGYRMEEANAMEDLWKLGFDEKLIESLIRDRVKTQSAISAIEAILGVTAKKEADDR